MYMLLIESRLKGRKQEFIDGWRSKVRPLLKKQKGFVDEILLCDEDQHCLGLCFWKTRAEGEQYRHHTFRQTKDLVGHWCSAPKVRGFEVEAADTFNIEAPKAA